MTKTSKSGWEIKRVSKSSLNGGFYIQGLNHESTDPLFANFYWHVRTLWDDGRYYFAEDVVIDPEAQAKLLTALRAA